MRGLALVTLLALGACTMGPNYVRPDVGEQAHFSQTAALPPVQATTPWWEAFHDRTLDRLVRLAEQANPDVKQAVAATEAARAAVTQAEAGGMPHLNGSLGATDTREFTPPDYVTIGYGSVGFDASWELDLWGKQRRTVEAAKDNAEAAQANADDARLTMLGDVARNYVALRGVQAQLTGVDTAIKTAHIEERLTQTQNTVGDGTGLEVAQAQAALATAEAARPPLEAQAQVAIHALSILCGLNPTTLLPDLSTPTPLPRPDQPGSGLPADLLRRRPDVRVAERQLAQATAEIGVAQAQLYPTLSLAGSIGLSGNVLSKMFAAPLFALGPSISAPLFDAGAKRAGVTIARAKVREAYAAYTTVVLKAEKEVEDALVNLDATRRQRTILGRELTAAQQEEKLALVLYTAGGADFLKVLDAQRTLTAAHTALTTNAVTLADQTVALYKALGGGYAAP